MNISYGDLFHTIIRYFLRSILLSFFRRILGVYFSIITDCNFFLRYVAARRFSHVIFRITSTRDRACKGTFRFMFNGLPSQLLIINVIRFSQSTWHFRLNGSTICLFTSLHRLLFTTMSQSSCRLSEDRIEQRCRAIVIKIKRSRNTSRAN